MLDTSKIYKSNNCGDFEIVKYNSCESVIIRFLITGTKKETRSAEIRSGLVKDECYPSVHGVGFIGRGKYNSKTRQYKTWCGMLERCYCTKFLEKHPSYKGCSVDARWHSFEIFAEWYDENYIKGFELDKDIKVKGNKVYSPEACMFVSHKDNTVFSSAKIYRMVSPSGELFEIHNLAKFCREKGLSDSNMNSVHHGRINQHKGWTRGILND